MDVRMPKMDGPQATREIRRLDGKRRDVPIIAVTADAMTQKHKEYLAAGMNGVVTKPVLQEQLLEAIDAALGEPIHTKSDESSSSTA